MRNISVTVILIAAFILAAGVGFLLSHNVLPESRLATSNGSASLPPKPLTRNELLISGVALGMTEVQVQRIKGPPSVQKGPHWMYLSPAGQSNAEETLIFGHGFVEAMSGCHFAARQIFLDRGMSMERLADSFKTIGKPTTINADSCFWQKGDYEITVVIEANRISRIEVKSAGT